MFIFFHKSKILIQFYFLPAGRRLFCMCHLPAAISSSPVLQFLVTEGAASVMTVPLHCAVGVMHGAQCLPGISPEASHTFRPQNTFPCGSRRHRVFLHTLSFTGITTVRLNRRNMHKFNIFWQTALQLLGSIIWSLSQQSLHVSPSRFGWWPGEFLMLPHIFMRYWFRCNWGYFLPPDQFFPITIFQISSEWSRLPVGELEMYQKTIEK